MVSSIIAGAIKCIGYPLAILCLLSLWGKKRIRDKVVLISIALLGLLWRIVYFSENGFSSRYCIFFVLLAIILAVISLADVPKTLSIILVATITVCQLCDAYNDYNKKYINDTKEYLDVLSNSGSAYIMIQEKEYRRLSDSTNKYVLLNQEIESEKDFNPVLDHYEIRGYSKKIYIATNDKREKKQHANPFIKEIFKSKSGRRYNNYFTVFFVDVQGRKKQSYAFESTNNLFPNGNFEKIENKEQTKRLLKKWVDAGFDFYDNDLLVLPQNHHLLTYWIVPRINEYPKVCLTTENPIEGMYSLFVEFQDKGSFYLLEKIEKKRGCLSFKIQSLDSKTHVTVTEYTYLHDSLILRNHYNIKDLILLDNEVHHISIIVPKRDNNEQQSLFSIAGSNTSFKLDDLSYQYMEDQ